MELEFEGEDIVLFSLEKWKAMAACNRCSDFLEYRRVIYKTVYRLHRQWELLRKNPKKKDATIQVVGAMETVIRKWLSTMNDFFRIDVSWDQKIMNDLLEGNASVQTVLMLCERMMRREAANPALRIGRAQFPMP